jgi:hypothetical protein
MRLDRCDSVGAVIAENFVYMKDFCTYTIIILRQDKRLRDHAPPAGSGGHYRVTARQDAGARPIRSQLGGRQRAVLQFPLCDGLTSRLELQAVRCGLPGNGLRLPDLNNEFC